MSIVIISFVISSFGLLYSNSSPTFPTNGPLATSTPVATPVSGAADYQNLYFQLNAQEYDLDLEIFTKAMTGYQYLSDAGEICNPMLTIVDFGRSSNQERMWVIDLENIEIKYRSLVAHGKNSGLHQAVEFSNEPESHKSSLGFYVTGQKYHGKHGLSLRLKGMEHGINHNAESRAIVVHGADYVSWDFIKKHHRLGRSWGCPALPKGMAEPVINQIAESSCLFIYSDAADYASNSKIMALMNGS